METGRMGTQLGRWLRWLLGVTLVVLLSGCGQYDLGIQFDHASHGQMVQRIQLGERTTALAGDALEHWLGRLQGQVQQLGGQVQRRGNSIALTLPFSSEAELVEEFNQIFQGAQGWEIPGLGRVRSHLSLTPTHRLFAVRERLVYDLDLQDLSTQAPPGSHRSGRPWLELHFQLQTPWGLTQAHPAPEDGSWRLVPGERHHIEAEFWLPNWIAIGGAAIATLVLLGYFLKYGGWRRRSSSDRPAMY